MKKFNIPERYNSSITAKIKELRRTEDPRKKDFSPAVFDCDPIKFLIARHFGFCYGVENAIEIAYKTIEENNDKRIYFLSEMIHNPLVNSDLEGRGVRFVFNNEGEQLIPWNEIGREDIVLIPAFGTTLEHESRLKEMGIDTVKYNTTCPFVERVWNRASTLGKQNYSVIIHGKARHEETRATFSHSTLNAPSIVIRNLEEARILSEFILGTAERDRFFSFFEGKYSKGFDPEKDLIRIGVVNQTTMLASETEAISCLLREAMEKKYGARCLPDHFADTRDTLCYATNDNQNATLNLMEEEADFALVIGGYKSSNTSHLVELLEKKFTTYFISGPDKIISGKLICHYDLRYREEKKTEGFLPDKEKISIAVTSGASCPDVVVDEVLNKLLELGGASIRLGEMLSDDGI
jgi:4-hydroxy-3-methylbut-2-en-1-yl diphosphate reductase